MIYMQNIIKITLFLLMTFPLSVFSQKNNEVIKLKYDDAESFSEGLAGVQRNEKWGFINTKGKEVIIINIALNIPS